jgi:PIN domain nuclease of toxin-antitoxin system
MIYLDTHVVAWLYAGEMERLSSTAIDLIESETLLVSPMVQLELEFLHEINRLTVGSALILESLRQELRLELCTLPFSRVVIESVQQNWTRDPFDRLIVAQARVRETVLLTKDKTILQHYGRAVW